MPLKLIPPRQGRSPYFYVRGTHRGVALDRSTKETERAKALRWLKAWRDDIDRGALSGPREPTFLDAAVTYMAAKETEEYLPPLVERLGSKALSAITQAEVDATAVALYPGRSPATRNRQVHTVVSAVLKHAGIEWKMKRPKGWRGQKSVSWLRPEEAFALLAAADEIEREFGLFLRVLLYTGLRLSEALRIRLRDVDLRDAVIHVPRTKNDEPRAVFVPPVLVAALANQPPRAGRPRRGDGPALRRGVTGRSAAGAGVPFLDRDPQARLFRFTAGGFLRNMLIDAKKTAGIELPARQGGFHLFRHTWGAWMRRYGGLDTTGLVGTGAWLDRTSAARYEHTTTTEDARRAALLPTPPVSGIRGKSVERSQKRRKA